MPQGGPGLLAVDHVVIAVTHRAGLQGSQVGTGAWLGITLAPPVFAAEDARQVMGLLLRCAELDDHRCNHADPEWQDPGSTRGRALFLEDVLLDHAPTCTAVLHRPTDRQPAALVEQAHPGDLIFLVETLAVATPRGHIGRQFVTQESAHFLTESVFGGGELDIH
ncbi:hypothetical protein D3C78_1458010 [compost metagenome]